MWLQTRTFCQQHAEPVFAFRQLQEKCREQNKDLHMVFVDLEKAFGRITRDLIWWCWERKECQQIRLHQLTLQTIRYSTVNSRSVLASGDLTHMLVSYCGEYPCECKKKNSRQIRQIVANIWRMGLRMQFASNRNDRKMIAIYS